MNLRAVWSIYLKDILDALKNMYIMFGLVLPLGISLLFQVTFAGESDDRSMTVAVFDPGRSSLVSQLRLLPQVEVIEAGTQDELPELVRKRAVGGLVVPEGFDAALQAGTHPALEIYVNRTHGGGEIAAFRELIQDQAWGLAAQEPPVRLAWTDLAPASGLGAQTGFRLDHFLLIMVLVMSLAMTGAFIVPTLLVEEKEKHTLDALLISPAGPVEVVAAKALTGMTYGLLVAGILLVMNHGWDGDWPVTVLAVFLGALLMIGVGLLMGAIFRTAPQVNTWSTVVMLGLMLPSWLGIIGPDTFLEKAFSLVPTAFLVKVMDFSLAGKASLGQVWDELALILGSILLVYAAVVWVLRRQER